MRRWLTVLGWVLIEAGLLLGFGPALARATPDDARARAALAGLRMPIIANQGQVDAKVAFYAPTFAGTLFVTRDGELVYALPAADPGAKRGKTRPTTSRGGWTFSEKLSGGRVRPVGEGPSATGISHFLGNDPARWRPNVPAFDQVALGEVWPGVSVALHARGRSIEKIFTVRPGASVDTIRVRVDGVTGLAVGEAGVLVARTGLGPVTFTAPVAYQEQDGVRRPVTVAYRLEGHEYGFTVGPYDRSAPLVIDPILQSTYLGGSDHETAETIAIHPATGDVYVGGMTLSSNFPHTLGGVRPEYGGLHDGFVARLNGSLTSFVQSTYLGGNNTDLVATLAIHPVNGDVYAVGYTASTNFPGTGGGAQPTFGGVQDGFVARLTPSLTTLRQATYLGGSGTEGALGLAIHPATGDVYVGGGTSSADFPHTGGAAQPTLTAAGGDDGYVARLNSALTTHIQSTYLGGSDTELVTALAIHPATGDVYAAGITGVVGLGDVSAGGVADAGNFPATAGGAQTAHGGGRNDGFVARLTASLGSLTQATYLGGAAEDTLQSITIHPMTGDIYVAGYTSSTNFPATAGGAQATYGGGAFDAFVARLSSSLTALTQATYLGGSGFDFALNPSLAIHPATGQVYVVGVTTSTDFPGTAGAAQPTPGGAGDAFVARLAASLTSLVQATYLGGSDIDDALGLAIHPATGQVYVVGDTQSASFPAVAGGGQATYGGGGQNDGFVTRLTFSLAAVDPLGLSALVNQPTFTTGQTLKLSIGVINPGLPGFADFFLGIVRPDGLFEFITGAGSVVGTLANIAPLVTGIPLTTPFAVPVPNLISRVWTGTEPRGNYTFVLVAFGGGQVRGLTSVSYSFP